MTNRKDRKAAYMQVTRGCNNECVFCSNPSFEENYSLKEAKEVIDKFKKDGFNEIILTGGEPTTWKYLSELITFIRSSGLDVKLITNGVNLSDIGYVKTLKKAGLESVNISIHSHKEKVMDALNSKKGHFKKSIKGMKNALDFGLIVTLNTTINSKNINHLDEFMEYLVADFAQIKHVVFNGLDPGSADGRTMSRARENPWIVPRLIDIELKLNLALKILKKNYKTFRVERIPLCYMGEFEEFSTETRKIVKDEEYVCSFLEKDKGNKVRKVKPDIMRMKAENCRVCSYDYICAGIQKEYIELYGDNEIYPLFSDPQRIIKKIKDDK